MNRKSFFKHLSVLGASFSIFARAAEAAKAKIGLAPKEKFEIEKKIFKLGKQSIKVKIPAQFKARLNDFEFLLSRENMNFEKQEILTSTGDENYFVFDVEFKKEGRYTIFALDKTFKDKKKRNRPIATLNMFAVADDLYALRPLKGDSHIHTTNSDGRDSPDAVALRCYEVGLDYQAISDHRRWDTSDTIKKKYEKYGTSMSFYHAEECHYAISHVQSFGATRCITSYIKENKAEVENRVKKHILTLPKDMPSKLKIEVARVEVECQIINEFGGLSVLNHPYWMTARQCFNMTDESVDAICARKKFDAYEFINFGCKDISASLANAKYTELRMQGIDYPLIGATDAHKIKDQGYAYTIVFSKSDKWEDVKQAILDKKSLAVCDTTYGECAPESRERMIYGNRRLINYAHFLVREYFPKHDALVKEEGAILAEIFKKGESDELMAKLKKVSAQTEALWDSIRG